jgi:hypothetical protein
MPIAIRCCDGKGPFNERFAAFDPKWLSGSGPRAGKGCAACGRTSPWTRQIYIERKGNGAATLVDKVARVTGLEPATSGVTGRHSNQLSYTRISLRPLAGRPLLPEGPASGGALDSAGGCVVSSNICAVFRKNSRIVVTTEIDLQMQNWRRLFHREDGEKVKQKAKNGIFRTAKV